MAVRASLNFSHQSGSAAGRPPRTREARCRRTSKMLATRFCGRDDQSLRRCDVALAMARWRLLHRRRAAEGHAPLHRIAGEVVSRGPIAQGERLGPTHREHRGTPRRHPSSARSFSSEPARAAAGCPSATSPVWLCSGSGTPSSLERQASHRWRRPR